MAKNMRDPEHAILWYAPKVLTASIIVGKEIAYRSVAY